MTTQRQLKAQALAIRAEAFAQLHAWLWNRRIKPGPHRVSLDALQTDFLAYLSNKDPHLAAKFAPILSRRTWNRTFRALAPRFKLRHDRPFGATVGCSYPITPKRPRKVRWTCPTCLKETLIDGPELASTAELMDALARIDGKPKAHA